MRHNCLVGILLPVVLFNPVTALEYEGVFAPAKSENGLGRFISSGLNGGMTFSKNCFGKRDPTPDDGFPGCGLVVEMAAIWILEFDGDPLVCNIRPA